MLWFRTLALATASSLALAAVTVAAQPYRNGWVATTYGSLNGLVRVSTGGAVTTVAKVSGSTASVMMDIDNRNYVVAANEPFIRRISPSGTLLASLPIPGGLIATEVSLHASGDYLVLAGQRFGNHVILRMDRAGSTVRTVWGPAAPWSVTSAVEAMVPDVRTGHMITFTNYRLHRLNVRNGQSTTLAVVAPFNFPIISTQITQDPTNGDLFIVGVSATSPLSNGDWYRVDRNGTVNTLGIATARVSAAAPTRASARRQRLVLGGSSGIHTLELSSQQRMPITAQPAAHVTPEQGRTLATEQIGTARWSIYIDVSEDANRPFAIALSAQPPSAVPLPDGRRIPLTVDALTLASVTGAIPTILRGGIGTLDANGSATATLDLSRLGPLPPGLRVWIGGVTFDPASPLGLRTILDPIILTQ